MSIVSRRSFLKLAGQAVLAASGLLGGGALVRFLGYTTEPAAPKKFDIGLATDYPPGSSTHLPEIPAMVTHNESGFSAFNLTCTHLGCSVVPQNGAMACPCHGSFFGADGEVLSGPAASGLEPLAVELTADGHLILQIS